VGVLLSAARSIPRGGAEGTTGIDSWRADPFTADDARGGEAVAVFQELISAGWQGTKR